MTARWLRLPIPERRKLPQCCAVVADPSHAPGWRARRYGPKATQRSPYHVANGQMTDVDPARCVRHAVVEIDGRFYCSIHGGQVALKKLAGEAA